MTNKTKCDNCGKNLTKKTPGIECRSCEKIMHASQACSGLTAKQLAALRNTDCIEWTCEDCKCNSSRRSSSFVIPDEDDEVNDELHDKNMRCCSFDTGKFLKEITSEMKKILVKELHGIETSITVCCSKIDNLTQTVELHKKEISELGKKYNNLKNDQTHLQLEIITLKQQLHKIEQQRLDNVLEVAGLHEIENLDEISSKLAANLHMNKDNILGMKRLIGRNGNGGVIRLELQHARQVDRWIRAARKQPVLVEHLSDDSSSTTTRSRVLLRRTLTKANKSLLWKAQQKLRPLYKYVWYQNGKVMIRQDNNEKPFVVRSEEDINDLVSGTEEENVKHT